MRAVHNQVLRVKSRLHADHGVAPSQHQQLYFQHHELSNSTVLGATGALDGSMLELTIEYSESLLMGVAFFVLAASAAGAIAAWMAFQNSFECTWGGSSSFVYVGRGLDETSCAQLSGECASWMTLSEPFFTLECPWLPLDRCVGVVRDEASRACRVDSSSVRSVPQSDQLLRAVAIVSALVAVAVAVWLLWKFNCAKDQRLMSDEIRMRLLPHARDIDPEACAV